MLKKILFVIIPIILIASIYSYREYNRKPANLLNIKPQQTITMDSLVAAYENDELKANAQFLGKPIMVKGIISELKNEQDTMLNIIIGNDGLHSVSCLLDKEELQNFKKYSIGNSISVKGICTGFLADVELNRCVIVDTGLLK